MNRSRSLLGLSSALTFVTLAVAPAAAAPKVVATIKPVHSLVAAVMAGVGTPTLLVEGQASLHGFALKPSGARAVAEADILVRVSETLEPFTLKATEALPAGATLITLEDVPGMVLLERRTGATFERHSHAEDHGAEHHGKTHDHDEHGHEGHAHDGHVWLDPINVRTMTRAIVAALSQRDPGNAASYKANGDALTGRIEALMEELRGEMRPFSGTPYVVFHDATQYFDLDFGPEAVGSVSVSPEVPPSAKRLAEIRGRIQSLGVKCVLADPQTPERLIATIIEGTKARSAVLDAEGATIEPPGPDLWFTLMRKAAATMKGCLGG